MGSNLNVYNFFQEFGHPHILLQKEEGYLQEIVRQTGPKMAEILKKIAETVNKFSF